jgi:propanol-preferring alcohol dehydrogenase
MKAARLHAYGEPFRLEEVPTPTPGDGEVVVRVLGAGFCHSDLHVMDGELKIIPHFPITLGHENAGVVAALGKGVTGWKEGDKVAVYGGWGCGLCDYCVSGQEQLCEAPRWVGLFGNDGGYAEYLRVPHVRYLVRLTTLEPRDAAPLTDAALTPYRAVKRALPVLTPDHPALLIGLGGLGQYGLKLLQRLSGVRVIVVDASDEKLKLARTLGAWKVVDARAKDAAEQVQALTSGKGVCAALDFVGADSTLALAVGATRSGGLVLHLGLAGGAAHLKPLATSRFEVTYEASLWGTIKELRELVALVEQGGLTLVPSEVSPLEEINDVARRLKRGEVIGRAVIAPG